MTRIGLIWPQTSALWTAGGIYFDNLLTALELAGQRDSVTVIEPEGGCFASSHPGEDLPLLTFQPRPRGSVSERAVDYATRFSGIGDRVASTIRRAGIDVVFGYPQERRRLSVPWVGWATDFQHHHYPQWFPPDVYASLDDAFGHVARDSSLVLLSSEDALKDYQAFVPQYASKGRVVPFVSVMPDELYAGDAAPAIEKYRIERPYVVVANQWWRHKNHEVALRAAGAMREAGQQCTWVMTGVLADYRDPGHVSRLLQLIAELGLEGDVKVLGVLPRMEQLQIMRAADCIVQPSLFEGWSTLVEDARALGQRLVVSDIPIHREQNPPASLFFDPGSASDLADKVVSMLSGACTRRDEVEAREEALAGAKVWGQRFYAVCEEAARR